MQLNVFPNQANQQVPHAFGDLVQGKQAGLGVRRPGHGQQLPHQAGGLHAGVADFFGILPHAMAWFKTGHEQVAVQQDSGQKIVEVVSHAAGQAADSFQLLGLPRRCSASRFAELPRQSSSNGQGIVWLAVRSGHAPAVHRSGPPFGRLGPSESI